MLLELVQNSVGELSGKWVSAVILIVLATFMYYYVQMKDNLPGPMGIPILGYWPFLDKYTSHIQLGKMKEKYGDIFGINVAGQLFVNLGTAKAVREAHITNSECFTQRSREFNVINTIFSDSVAFTNGEKWRNLRKFFLNVFKERGMTSVKTTLDVPMSDAMMAVIEDLREKNGQPVSIIDLLQNRCNNLFKESMFGSSTISISDIKAINDHYQEISNQLNPYNMLMSGWIAKYFIMPFATGFKSAMYRKKEVIKLITNIIKEQRTKQEENDSIITAFYKEKEARRKKGDPTYEYFTDEDLAGSLLQFIGDGALSAAIFVSIFFKALLENPKEQESIFQELQEVVGPNRQPSIDDKLRMPYTTAFMHEVLRTNDFFPFFPSLECTKETVVGGYKIPKGSVTLVNMWSAHNDPDTYENPGKFDPSRFIQADGKQRIEHPITFGVGKRSCIGEGFVMIQAFLFLTTLIKNFRLEKVDPDKKHKSTFDMLRSKGLIITALPRNK